MNRKVATCKNNFNIFFPSPLDRHLKAVILIFNAHTAIFYYVVYIYKCVKHSGCCHHVFSFDNNFNFFCFFCLHCLFISLFKFCEKFYFHFISFLRLTATGRECDILFIFSCFIFCKAIYIM